MKCESILPVQQSKMKHERVAVVPQPMSTTKESSTNSVGLTEREVEVLDLVAQGLTNAQIARKLVVSVQTVNTHVRSIFTKLEVNSRSAATRSALEQRSSKPPGSVALGYLGYVSVEEARQPSMVASLIKRASRSIPARRV